MRTHPILALALQAGTSALQASIVFDVTTTSVTPTLAASFGLFGKNTPFARQQWNRWLRDRRYYRSREQRL